MAQVDRPPGLLQDLVDVSADFHEYRNTYFLADKLTGFDPVTGTGAITWARHQLAPRIAFSNMENVLRPFDGITFPEGEYAINPALPFSIQFVSPRTVRIRLRTGPQVRAEEPSLMLAGEPPRDGSWKLAPIAGGYRYTSVAGSVTILENPWHIEFRDSQGRLLTKTNHASDNATQLEPVLPFSFIRRTSDYSRSIAAVFSGSGERWLITMRSVAYVWQAASDYALHHHHEEDLAFVPSAEPAHPPAIDTITQDRRLAETEESGLDLQFLQSARRCRRGWFGW